MKILFVGDTHLSDVAPRSRKDDYTSAIFDKLAQVVELAKSYNYVIMLGDIFHRKKPWENSHSLVGRLMDVLALFPKNKTYALVGNHDIRDGNMACLPEQPLGIIFRSGLLKQLTHDMIFEELGPKGMKVQTSPLPFSYEAETNPVLYQCKRAEGADYVIRLTHASILPQGLPHLAYKMPHVVVDQVWGQSWDLLVNGHIHHHSPIATVGSQHFVNIGAIARGALNSWALEQTPKVLGVDLEWGLKRVQPKFTWHELKVKPAEEVFRIDQALTIKSNNKAMDAFVADIKDRAGQITLKAQAIMDLGLALDEYLAPQNVSTGVKNKAKEYLGAR